MKESLMEYRSRFHLIGAISAFLTALLFRRNWSAEAGLLFPDTTVPVTALEWFTLIQENRFLGLVLLDFFDIINYICVAITFFVLYYVLKDEKEIMMRCATVICYIGLVVSIVSNQAFSMLFLSDKYFSASIADQQYFIAAGEALLTINQGFGDYFSLFALALSGFIISLVMYQTEIFSKLTVFMGILANGLLLSFFITIIISPEIGWIPIPLSSIPLLIWYLLIGLKLVKIEKNVN